MAQHDYVIANQSGSAFRADLNNALAASVSTNSGSSAPSTTYAYMLWADTTNNLIKLRNSANNAWITLFTTAGGLDVDAASNFNEDVTFTGASASVTWDKSTDDLIFNDNAKAVFGTSSDGLEIYHNSNDSYIVDTGTGDLKIRSTSGIQLQKGSTNYLTCAPDLGVDLYFNGDRKLKTLSTGAEVESTTGNTNFIVHAEHDDSGSYASIKAYTENNQAPCYLMFGDADDSFVGGFKYENSNDQLIMYTNNTAQWYINSDGHFRNNSDTRKIQCGAGEDLEIYHTGTQGEIRTVNGHLHIRSEDSIILSKIDADGGNPEVTAKFLENGAVELYYDNSAKLATQTQGIAVTGTIRSQGTYDNTTSNAANMYVHSSPYEFYRSTSSIKYKDNVTTLTDAEADNILNCRPVTYTSKCSVDNPEDIHYGLIAEEVKDIDSRLVVFEGSDPENVKYDRFIPHLINLVRRLTDKVETLETKIAALEAK